MNYLALFLTLAFMVVNSVQASQDSAGEDLQTEVSTSEESMDADAASEPSLMDQPLDGTSIESFTAGLEKLDGEITEDEYRKLMSALDYLLFYDIGARRDKARLYSRLNGKTPNEILERVANNRKK